MEDQNKGEKLYRNLASIIQCPICEQRLNGNIYMCGSGHSICFKCTRGATICNQCQEPYTKIQNLAIQSLLLHFDNLQKFLIELDNLRLKLKESTKTKYGMLDKDIDQLSTDTNDGNQYGKFRCWITNQCRFDGYISTIIKHLRIAHSVNFQENINGDLPYAKSWEMDYFSGNYRNNAIKVGKLLFIVDVSINDNEELGMHILMYVGQSKTSQYSCEIEFTCDGKKFTFKNIKILSVLSPEHIILKFKRNCLQKNRNQFFYHMLRKHKRFICSILLDNKISNISTVQNTDESNKKMQKNNRSAGKVDMPIAQISDLTISTPNKSNENATTEKFRVQQKKRDKQLEKLSRNSQSSTFDSDANKLSNTNKLECPQRESIKINAIPEVINNQPTSYPLQSREPNLLYPNLKMHTIKQKSEAKLMPSPTTKKISRLSAYIEPSAPPIEPSSPYNPYFLQPPINSNNSTKLTKKKNPDNCAMF